jgi:biotin carboxyl carrier protein
MKMETEIVAPTDGVVVSVLVKKGDAVETDASLVILN